VQASADHAADLAASGQPVVVVGSSRLGIARQTLFADLSGGKYAPGLLREAITKGDRPVDALVADINSLTADERDQAIKDIAEERTNQARKLADLQRQGKQSDPNQQALLDGMIEHLKAIMLKADQVLDGVSVSVATSDSPASLTAGTVAPTAEQKPLIESALKPELRPGDFKEDLPGDQKKYIQKLREATPLIIADLHKRFVENKGPKEHAEKSKVHPLSEFERIGNASKRETDKVFGHFLTKPRPSLKADTATSRGSIHDLFADTEAQLKGMSANQKREMARQLIIYIFQSSPSIAEINRLHNADPKFKPALNDEAKDQQLVATELTATPEQVKQLNEIDRGWPGTAGEGSVNIQRFRTPDEVSGPLAGPDVADRNNLWLNFQILIHEYLHTLVHPKYEKYAEKFGTESKQWNTLIEGVDTLLDEIVWSSVAPHVTDPDLRKDVEGPIYSQQPPIDVKPASQKRYLSYAEAVKLVNIVGIRNLYAAYFLGDVEKIRGTT